MILNNELREDIEDAFIYFEDNEYSYNIESIFDMSTVNRNVISNTKVYDLAKKILDNDEYTFTYNISIHLRKLSVMSWRDWTWYNNTLSTALKRLSSISDDISISQDDKTIIRIGIGKFVYKNIKKLADMCKYFNSHNEFGATGKGHLLCGLEYDPSEGIVCYIRESPLYDRFDMLNKANDNERATELKCVTLEDVFGKDCIIKTYEKGDALKENPYLSRPHYADTVVAKIKIDYIKP